MDEVCRVHGAVWAREGVRPANTLIGGAKLVGQFKVEVEVEAVVGGGGGKGVVLRV